MTVSSMAIVFTRYIILEWLRRRSNDQKTICELFYVCCDDIQDIELSTALKQLLKILCNGIKNRAITITNEIKVQLINWFVSRPAFIKALYPDLMWEVWGTNFSAIWKYIIALVVELIMTFTINELVKRVPVLRYFVLDMKREIIKNWSIMRKVKRLLIHHCYPE